MSVRKMGAANRQAHDYTPFVAVNCNQFVLQKVGDDMFVQTQDRAVKNTTTKGLGGWIKNIGSGFRFAHPLPSNRSLYILHFPVFHTLYWQ